MELSVCGGGSDLNNLALQEDGKQCVCVSVCFCVCPLVFICKLEIKNLDENFCHFSVYYVCKAQIESYKSNPSQIIFTAC